MGVPVAMSAGTPAGKKSKKSSKKVKKQEREEQDDGAVTVLRRPDSAEPADASASAGVEEEGLDKEQSEQLEQVMRDIPEFKKLLAEFTEKIQEARKHIQAMTEKIRNNDMPMEKGLSFLDVKLHLLLAYCVDIAFVLLHKTRASEPFAGHPVIRQLIELRAFIEKIRPLDGKLKNQIDKLVRAAAQQEAGASGVAPTQYRPNPEDLVSKEEEELGGGEEGEEEMAATSGVYVPPRIAAVRFDEDTAADKRRKKEERQAKKLRDSELYRELREEFAEEPTEIRDYSRLFSGEVYDRAHQERKLRYEEDHFTRLQETKQEKKQKKMRKFRNELEELTKFGNLKGLGRSGGDRDDLDKIRRKQSLKEFMAAEKKQSGKQGGGKRSKKGPPRKKQRT